METGKVNINNIEIEVQKETAELYNHFSTFSKSYIKTDLFSELLVKIFNLNYLKDLNTYYGIEKVGRSNWTQHTANTFLKTCQLVRLNCDFEVENRHDGAIRDYNGNVYLCAEWEFDTNSIFNPKGEINKLVKTCQKYKNCDALLFTYTIDTSYKEFCEKVYNQWNEQIKSIDEDFYLYLVTAIMKKNEEAKTKEVYGLRTVVIGRNSIEFWEDEYF